MLDCLDSDLNSRSFLVHLGDQRSVSTGVPPAQGLGRTALEKLEDFETRATDPESRDGGHIIFDAGMLAASS